jgi:hypothetical protein
MPSPSRSRSLLQCAAEAPAYHVPLLALALLTACDPRAGASAVPPTPESPPSSALTQNRVTPPPDPLLGPDSARVRARIDSVFALFDRPAPLNPGAMCLEKKVSYGNET